MTPRVVVVTGASAGIGRATAIAFAKQGWAVGLLARGADGLEGARRDVEDAGGRALAIVTDVADSAQVEAAASRVELELGPIEVWVNNAMATIFCDFLAIDPADFRRSTEVTYLGAVWGTRAALKRMKLRNRGTIVQVGSALAYRSIPLQSPYCGAKSALRGFTDSLRSELIHDRSDVHLTMVHLSAFNTPQFDWGRTCMHRKPRPLGKIFQPEVAADAIYWAAQHKRRELWVGMPAAEAIVGTRVMPGVLDHLLARRAYDGQQSREPVEANRRDNLYEPVPGDHGAHGRFDEGALECSAQLWATTHRARVGMLALPLLGLLGWLITRTR
ncbi:MAG TPA: SDR family oxidoreductase [Burkholderiales bacterium]|jgi:NAD(P)-dependent dehydrogenase (short-subunit alcohol dehydrogenase family)|nr:SDR family oxidoreductase [Burkholderiales bacterium]